MVLNILRIYEPSIITGFERKNLVSPSSDERRGLKKFNIEVICQRMIYPRFHEPKKFFLVKDIHVLIREIFLWANKEG